MSNCRSGWRRDGIGCTTSSGHLTAVHDRLFALLGVGERLHPELDAAFITNPDGGQADPVSAAELRKAWSAVNTKLTAALEKFTPAELAGAAHVRCPKKISRRIRRGTGWRWC